MDTFGLISVYCIGFSIFALIAIVFYDIIVSTKEEKSM